MLIQNDFRRRTKTNGLQMRLNLGEGVEEGGSGYSRNFGWGVPLFTLQTELLKKNPT